jgi:hemolysin activation/secretion protein
MSPRQNPTRGVSAGLGAEVGSRKERYPGLPEASRSLLRGAVSLATVASLGGPRVLYGAVRAEQVSLSGADFPSEELLYLGGSEGLRGHRDRAFGGNRIAGVTLEHRWLTDPKGGRAYFFVDGARHSLDAPLSSGVVAAPGGSTTLARTVLSDGWELGYGAGLKTPVASGVAGVELGLAPGAALREATIHVRYASRW